MIRVGLVDFDTSHVVAFTQRWNHIDCGEEQWVEGAKVVAGCPGVSYLSPERVPGFTEKLRGYGVEIVDKPEDLLDKIDAVCIESVDGSVHLERARPFIEAGLPVYVDKPFTCSLADALELVGLAEKKGIPLFSSSSLRYGVEVLELAAKQEEYGAVVGADCYAPASLHPRNPGLFHYGIHGVETLFALMGKGCVAVQSATTGDVDLVTGYWNDGRIGTVRGIRKGASGYGFTAFCEKKTMQTTINAGYIYRELLKRITEMFETGKAPLDIRETLELTAFIEGAIHSTARDGRKVELAL
ncbi:MAG: Gfo/Idh/MocA family oxidoreductase [Candidatus Poribacteria bacterium]|nr:Gfo/Idh/MocA family oxidoreductase [Candidatus Poribacteria bacterium]